MSDEKKPLYTPEEVLRIGQAAITIPAIIGGLSFLHRKLTEASATGAERVSITLADHEAKAMIQALAYARSSMSELMLLVAKMGAEAMEQEGVPERPVAWGE